MNEREVLYCDGSCLVTDSCVPIAGVGVAVVTLVVAIVEARIPVVVVVVVVVKIGEDTVVVVVKQSMCVVFGSGFKTSVIHELKWLSKDSSVSGSRFSGNSLRNFCFSNSCCSISFSSSSSPSSSSSSSCSSFCDDGSEDGCDGESGCVGDGGGSDDCCCCCLRSFDSESVSGDGGGDGDNDCVWCCSETGDKGDTRVDTVVEVGRDVSGLVSGDNVDTGDKDDATFGAVAGEGEGGRDDGKHETSSPFVSSWLIGLRISLSSPTFTKSSLF